VGLRSCGVLLCATGGLSFFIQKTDNFLVNFINLLGSDSWLQVHRVSIHRAAFFFMVVPHRLPVQSRESELAPLHFCV